MSRIGRATLSEVSFHEDDVTSINEFMMTLRKAFMRDPGNVGVETAYVELIDTARRRAVGVVRFHNDSGLTFTPAAEELVV
jgi:hypothetical protein